MGGIIRKYLWAIATGVFAQPHLREHSDALTPCIEQRWREAGYRSFSAYLTALIRYDLLLLGPHKHYSGDDWTAARMAELDAKTVQAFHEGKPRALMIDHLLDRAAGRELTPPSAPLACANSPGSFSITRASCRDDPLE